MYKHVRTERAMGEVWPGADRNRKSMKYIYIYETETQRDIGVIIQKLCFTCFR